MIPGKKESAAPEHSVIRPLWVRGLTRNYYIWLFLNFYYFNYFNENKVDTN